MSGIFTEVIGYLRKAMPKGANIVSLHISKELFNKMKTYETSDNQEYVVLQVSAHELRVVMDAKEDMYLAKINGKMEEEE
tara:strand:+ start:548 stop:787 length:240 start_codon:yes stop_codon:yes gene_type:complete